MKKKLDSIYKKINYNENIDINNNNFEIKNLLPIYFGYNFERNQNDLEYNIEKKEYFSNSDNDHFFNFKKIDVIDLLDYKKSVEYDEDIKFNNKRNLKFSNEKVKNSYSEFDNLFEKDEEYDNIKKYFGEFIFNEVKDDEN